MNDLTGKRVGARNRVAELRESIQDDISTSLLSIQDDIGAAVQDYLSANPPVGLDGMALNVRDFGATGDGVTNDTAAFHAAIDALPATGGTIFVPEGVYIVAVRVKKPRTRIIGQGWNSVLKIQANAVQKDTDCPLRLLADECYVADLSTHGNRANNAQMDDPVDFDKAAYADGIGIFANYCTVERVKTDDHLGHHIIAWSSAFELENIPAAARHHNVVRYCYSTNRGVRNMLDFASLDWTQNVNHHNSFVGNIVEGEIVIHTGTDTIVEGNYVRDSITIHTACHRVIVRNNVVGKTIVLRGGVDGAPLLDPVRRSSHLIADGNLVVGDITAIRAVGADNVTISNNTTLGGSTSGIRAEMGTDVTVSGNHITGCAVGFAQPYGTSENVYLEGLRITGNKVVATGAYALQLTRLDRAVISDNDLTATGRTVYVTPAADNTEVVVRGNVIDGGVVDPVVYVEATDATVEGCRINGRVLMRGDNNTLRNNTIASPATVVNVMTPSAGFLAHGNRCTGDSFVLATGALARDNTINGAWAAET